MDRKHTYICSSSVSFKVCVSHNGPQKDTSQLQSSSVARQQGETTTDRNTAHSASLLLLQSGRGACVCVHCVCVHVCVSVVNSKKTNPW